MQHQAKRFPLAADRATGTAAMLAMSSPLPKVRGLTAGLPVLALLGIFATPLHGQTCAPASGFELPVKNADAPAGLVWDVPVNPFGNYLTLMGGYHPGEDWNLVNGSFDADLGKPVYAVGNGTVVAYSDLGKLGKLLAIEHSGSFVIPAQSGSSNSQSYSYEAEVVASLYSVYLHIENVPPALQELGACIAGGTALGTIMDSGNGPHLHFEIRHPSQNHSNNWSMVYPDGNWVVDVYGNYNGYYLDLQAMVDSYLRHPRSVVAANPSDRRLAGDWDGDGVDGVWTFTEGEWMVPGDDNGGIPVQFTMGVLGDLPVVGDWDGDGRDDPGIFRASDNPSAFHLDVNHDAVEDWVIPLAGSYPQDIPVAGDWDGDGDTDIGAWDSNTRIFWLFRITSPSTFEDHASFQMGNAGDVPITGNWDGAGPTEVGVFRTGDPNANTNNFYFRKGDGTVVSLTELPGGMPSGWGNAGDRPIVGDWNNDGYDTIGLYRPPTQETFLNDDLPKLDAQTETPLACGATVSDAIDPAGEEHLYTFTGTAADVIYASVVTTAAIDPGFVAEVELLAPSGASLGYTTTSRQWILSTTGTYTLRVVESHISYNAGTRRGTFDLRLEWISPASRACTTTPISCGQTQSAMVDFAAQRLYTFAGTAADVIYASVMTTAVLDAGFVAEVELLAPSGASLGYTTTSRQWTLSTTGIYTLRVMESRINYNTGTRRGTFDLRLEWVSPASRACTATPISCGQTQGATVDFAAQRLYTFASTAADVIYASVVTTAVIDAGFVAEVELFAPGGASLGYTTTFRQWTLTTTGIYTLRVKESRISSNEGTRRGTFDLRLEWISPTPCPAPEADLSITKTDGQASTVPGAGLTYTIVVANAGPSVATGATVTDMLPAALAGPSWTCIGSAGGSCPASGSGDINTVVTLPAGGTVTFTITGTVSSSATGTLTNTATVEPPAGVTDPALSNNSATDADTLVTGEPIGWERFIRTEVQGTALRRPSGVGWNAGAVSNKVIASGDGYVEYTVPATPGYAMFGLSHGDTDGSYIDIDYALYTYPPTAQLIAYEKGVFKGYLETYQAGDQLRVSVEAGVVTYRKNGEHLGSSLTPPTYPLLADTSLYASGTELWDGRIAGLLEDRVALAAQDVFWRNIVGASASGATLTRENSYGWNGGGSSAQELVSGDGYAEYRVASTSDYVMFGLSHGDTDQGYADIDYALYTYPPTGQVMVFEGGTHRMTLGGYTMSDVLRVGVEGGVVTYSVNGVLLYRSSAPPTYPLVADTSLYSPNATVADAKISGELKEIVSWTHLNGVQPIGDTLTRPVLGGWTAGAISERQIPTGAGGAEYTVADLSSYVMFGLSHGDTDGSYADIDYALYTYPPTQQLMVFEQGVYKRGFGSYAVGDVLKVTVEDGVVTYWKNGSLLYASATTATYPLVLDVSLYAGTIQGARMTGNLITPPVIEEAVSWTSQVNVTDTGGMLARPSGSGWNAGAVSTQTLSGDGYVEYTVSSTSDYVMFGLGNGDTDQGYADIEYAIYTYPGNGQLYVYEGGVPRALGGSYAVGDKLRVSVEGGAVKYRKNGMLIYGSANIPAYPLNVDTSLYSTGATVSGSKIGREE